MKRILELFSLIDKYFHVFITIKNVIKSSDTNAYICNKHGNVLLWILNYQRRHERSSRPFLQIAFEVLEYFLININRFIPVALKNILTIYGHYNPAVKWAIPCFIIFLILHSFHIIRIIFMWFVVKLIRITKRYILIGKFFDIS